jgi:hypothetical protein
MGKREEMAMKRSRFSEQQIAFILYRAEEGVAVEDVRWTPSAGQKPG